MRRKFAPLTITALAMLPLAPVIPVMKAFEARYAFALWLVVVITIVAGASAIERSWLRVSLLTIAIVSTLVANRTEWRTTMAIAERMSAEGRWFLAANAGAVLRRPAIPPGTWDLGPYEGGQYRFVFSDGVQAFDVPIELDFVNHPDVRLPKPE